MKRLRMLAVILPAYAVIVSWSLLAQGQGGNPQAPAAPATYSSDPMIQALKWRNVGNANLVGRISAVDALENDFSHVVVGSASGRRRRANWAVVRGRASATAAGSAGISHDATREASSAWVRAMSSATSSSAGPGSGS